MKRAGARIVVRAPRKRCHRHLLPLFPGESRHQNVMHPRELPANLDNLLGALALRQDDFGEAHAALAIEVERVVGALHAGDSNRIVSDERRLEA